MRALSRGLPLVAALLLATAPAADRRGPAALRVVAGAAPTAAHAAAASLPRFATFGWVSPPRESTTAARYVELANAGFNVTVLAWEDSGRVSDNLARLDFCAPLGVRNLIVDRRLERFRVADTTTHAVVDTVVATYEHAPALGGWYLGDEPAESEFALLEAIAARVRRAGSTHPVWNNLRGRGQFATREAWMDYNREYVRRLQPAVLCNDQYDFFENGDRGLLVENVAGLASVARENGLPFWGVVNIVQHGTLRRPTQGLIRWQVAQWLSYGATGIGYFTYWTPAPDTVWNWRPAMIAWGTGERTALYDTVRALNVPVRAIGETIAGLQWLATLHTGDVPNGGTPFAPSALLRAVRGRAAIGVFADTQGAPYLFVANRDSISPATVTLTLGGARLARLIADDGAWHDLAVESEAGDTRATVALGAGGFTLIALTGTLDGVVAGRGGPALALAPNPARGTVRFAARDVSLAARLELLDLSGRRVWSRPLPAGASAFAWNGERDAGGRARAGVYFARLEDARGVAVQRLTWLGRP